MIKSKNLKQLRIRRRLKKVKKVEEHLKRDPYAKFCGISKNRQLIQDFCKVLKNKKKFGLFCIRYLIRDISPLEKRNALKAYDIIQLKNITLYYNGTSNKSDLIERLQVLISMIKVNNYNVNKWNNMDGRLSLTKFLNLYVEDYLSKKSFPIKHSLLYYQFLFGIGSTVVGLILMSCFIYYMWGYSALMTMLGLLLVYCVGVTIEIYKN